MKNYFFKIGIRDNTSHKSKSRYVNNISLIILNIYSCLFGANAHTISENE